MPCERCGHSCTGFKAVHRRQGRREYRGFATSTGSNAAAAYPCDLTAMKRAEASLVSAVHAAASEVEQIGQGALDAALARLTAAAGAARARIAEAMTALCSAVAGMLISRAMIRPVPSLAR
jgi:hypothetical protein